MVILLAIFALLGVFGGGLGFCFASTVFQQIVAGLVVASGFTCMVGTSILEVLVAFKMECKTASDNTHLLGKLKETCLNHGSDRLGFRSNLT